MVLSITKTAVLIEALVLFAVGNEPRFFVAYHKVLASSTLMVLLSVPIAGQRFSSVAFIYGRQRQNFAWNCYNQYLNCRVALLGQAAHFTLRIEFIAGLALPSAIRRR